MPELSLRPNLSQEDFNRLNALKKKTGVTKVHFIQESIKINLDVYEGKATVVYHKELDCNEESA